MSTRLIAMAAAAAYLGAALPASADQPLENGVLNFGQCVSFFAFSDGGAAAGDAARSSGPVTIVTRTGRENDPPGQEPPQTACTTLKGYFPPPPDGPR
jgi:hypothetical protein